MLKKVSMFMSEAINVPVLGIIENMAYFTQKNYLKISIIFWKRRSERSAEECSILGRNSTVQSIREAGDYGRPAAMQTASPSSIF
jgi:ATP-binding protein involved in chromosome partitioning